MRTPENFLIDYERALASQDWDRVSPLIHEDCVAIFTDGTYSGKKAIEAVFRRNFDLIQDEAYRISEVDWILKSGDTAVLSFIFSWSGTINGRPASGSGRGSSVLVMEKGTWQLICEHLGPLPP